MKNLLLLVMNFLLCSVSAQINDLFEKRVLTEGKHSLPYRIMYPENFDPSSKYPLIIFLHGRGERGNDNQKQLVLGSAFFAASENRSGFPAVVVFPQCDSESSWANMKVAEQGGRWKFEFNPGGKPTVPMRLTIELIEDLREEKWVDKDRVYLGGLSMGGMGTFELLYRKPTWFAAAFPICGAGNPQMINPKTRFVKIWAFHGTEDVIVSPEYSAQMVEAYKKSGVDVRLTLYENVGHNAWDFTFREPELMNWLFSCRR